MCNVVAAALLVFTATLGFPQIAASPPSDASQIAITFDDLPAHGPLPPSETRMDIATRIIAALHEAHVPPTYGFVNALRTQEQPGDVAVLKAWGQSSRRPHLVSYEPESAFD